VLRKPTSSCHTLSLHDALPISEGERCQVVPERDSGSLKDADSRSSVGGGVAPSTWKTGYDRPGGVAEKAAPPGPTPSEERIQVERVFGRGVVDIRRCEPCPRCGAAVFAREYS